MHDPWKRLTGAVLVLFLAGAVGVRAASLRVGSDISAAPFEFYQPGSKQPVGFDIDLVQAMAAKLGRPLALKNHQFDDLLSAVRQGRLDFAISSISDTRSREQQVDFIDYFIGGGGIVVPAGNPDRIFNLPGLCGYSVTVESGTSYEANLNAQSADCKAMGLGAVRVLSFPTDDGAFAAFLAGHSAAYVADYPVDEYRVRYERSKNVEIAGAPFNVVPYGIAVAKNDAPLRGALQGALVAVIQDGTYDRLLRKWGLEVGGLRSAPIDAGTLFQAK